MEEGAEGVKIRDDLACRTQCRVVTPDSRGFSRGLWAINNGSASPQNQRQMPSPSESCIPDVAAHDPTANMITRNGEYPLASLSVSSGAAIVDRRDMPEVCGKFNKSSNRWMNYIPTAAADKTEVKLPPDFTITLRNPTPMWARCQETGFCLFYTSYARSLNLGIGKQCPSPPSENSPLLWNITRDHVGTVPFGVDLYSTLPSAVGPSRQH